MYEPNHNYPKILYKYRSWDNKYHKKILTENQLYLASPKDFNDPFDCRITSNYRIFNTNEKRTKYVDSLIHKHKKEILKRKDKIEDVRLNMLDRFVSNPALFQEEQDELAHQLTENHYGVLSLSARWDSLLMWSHYGDFHKGFCIGFNELKLRKSGFFGSGGMVTYNNQFPSIDPMKTRDMSQVLRKILTKSKDWEYESEYRLTKLFYPGTPSGKDRQVVVPDEYIEQIILGIHITEENKSEILKIALDKNIRVYQAYKVPFEFKVMSKLLN